LAPNALGNVGGGKEGVSANLLDELVDVFEASYGLEFDDDDDDVLLLLLVDDILSWCDLCNDGDV
jgi:hypothetical protein